MPATAYDVAAPPPIAAVDASVAFDRLFRLEVARTTSERMDAFAVRYQVYCEEFAGYEPKDRFPDRLERNPSDEHSVHVVIRRRHDRAAIAAARLVLADPARPMETLPIAEVCPSFPGPGMPDQASAEISRVCLTAPYRLRSAGLSPDERGAVPAMPTALILACFAAAHRMRIDAVYALMERRFAILVRRKRMVAEAIGPAISHHGLRIPFRVGAGDSRERMPLLAALADLAVARAAPFLPGLAAVR